MAVIEQSSFNGRAFDSFTPKVSRDQQVGMIGALLITALAVCAGMIIYELISKKLDEEKVLLEHYST